MSEGIRKVVETHAVIQSTLEMKEILVDRDLDKLEARLNMRIDEVKEEINKLNNRIDKFEDNIKWFVGKTITIGGIIISVVVALIVKYL